MKTNGKFIGTCLDGKKLFDRLSINDSIGVTDLWNIEKKYNQTTFPNNDSCLGYVVNIFNESIGISIEEYLVNFDYLVEKAKSYNLELVEINSFSTLFDKLSNIKEYGSMKKMSEELKEYSFLNNAFVFQKK